MVAAWQNGICNEDSRTTEGVLFSAPDPIKAVMDKKRTRPNGQILVT